MTPQKIKAAYAAKGFPVEAGKVYNGGWSAADLSKGGWVAEPGYISDAFWCVEYTHQNADFRMVTMELF